MIEAQIDTWVDYIQCTVVPAATRVLDQVGGRAPSDQRTFGMSLTEFKQTLACINEHLALRNFLVGHQLSLADALLVSILATCLELVLDKKTRDNLLPNLARYATLVLRMAPFVRVFGNAAFCKDVTQPDFNAYEKPKKEQQPKKDEGKKQQPKKEEGKKQQKAAAAASTTEEEKK